MRNPFTALRLYTFFLFSFCLAIQTFAAARVVGADVPFPSDEGVPIRTVYVPHDLAEQYKHFLSNGLENEANAVKHQFENYAKPSDPAYGLCSAVAKGDAATLEQCLEKGINPNTLTQYYDEEDRDKPDSERGYIQIYCLLHEAAAHGFISVADILIRYGANVNWENRHLHTPLSVAALRDQEDMVEYLLRKGANPNQVIGYDRRDVVLLRHMEEKKNYGPIAKKLLTYGANVDNALYAFLSHVAERQINGLIYLAGAVFLIHHGGDLHKLDVYSPAAEGVTNVSGPRLIDILPADKFILERAILEAARKEDPAIVADLNPSTINSSASASTTWDRYWEHTLKLARAVIASVTGEDAAKGAELLERAREIFGSVIDS